MGKQQFKSIAISGAGFVGLDEMSRLIIRNRGAVSKGEENVFLSDEEHKDGISKTLHPANPITILKSTPPRSMTEDEKIYYAKHKTLQGFTQPKI